MKAYKGFNKDMTCRGFQYEEGKTYETDKASLCKEGFHACENPLDCFGYYAPGESVFHEVEIDDNGERSTDDSKVVGKKISIGAELSVAQICKLHFEYTSARCTNSEIGKNYAKLSGGNYSSLSGGYSSSLSGGNYSSLSGGDRSSLSGGDSSSLSGGYRSSLSGGDSSSLSGGDSSSLSGGDSSSLSGGDYSSLSGGDNSAMVCFNGKAKGGKGSVICIANRNWQNGEYVITDFACGIVDGENIKADTWYKCDGGKLVEVCEE